MVTSSSASEKIREKILSIGVKCGKAVHFGGSLSLVEILSVLYFDVMRHNPSDPGWAERDRLILSKGHAALALYVTLHIAGYLSEEDLDLFMVDGSSLIAHPVKNIGKGIEASTGSLGQGIGFAVGLAEGLRRKAIGAHVFCIIGDGESNEGSVHEALRLASMRGLSNLTVIVDRNGMQNDGDTRFILPNNSLEEVYRAVGLNVVRVDGHDTEALRNALSSNNSSNPLLVVADTIKGFGVDLMERNNDWHHNRLTLKTFENLKGNRGS